MPLIPLHVAGGGLTSLAHTGGGSLHLTLTVSISLIPWGSNKESCKIIPKFYLLSLLSLKFMMGHMHLPERESERASR